MDNPSAGVWAMLWVLHRTKLCSFLLAHLMLLLHPILHLSPNPPGMFSICHRTCFNMRSALGVIVNPRLTCPMTRHQQIAGKRWHHSRWDLLFLHMKTPHPTGEILIENVGTMCQCDRRLTRNCFDFQFFILRRTRQTGMIHCSLPFWCPFHSNCCHDSLIAQPQSFSTPLTVSSWGLWRILLLTTAVHVSSCVFEIIFLVQFQSMNIRSIHRDYRFATLRPCRRVRTVPK